MSVHTYPVHLYGMFLDKAEAASFAEAYGRSCGRGDGFTPLDLSIETGAFHLALLLTTVFS